MDIKEIREALEAYRDLFSPGDKYCTCDPYVGYMCENCARRRQATNALAALSAILADEPKKREAEGPQVGDACLFWDETRYGIEYDVGLLSLHHNGEYYMRSGFGWKNCRALARQITIQEITRADGDSREG